MKLEIVYEQHYGTKFVQVLPKLTLEEQAEKFGDELWKSDANQCCDIRKVDPLTDILKNMMPGLQGFAVIKHLLVLMLKK